ncbi:MAG: hypothetical protein H3Z53_10125 [archaeon]|nr:hypothetical protein [archaeon]MCP8314705.1 hypothetical protein [archaeon]MCP8315587.1 hypothetical protein [archaeon]
MPIVEGRYEAKISTTFSTIEEGIEEIKRKIQKSRRIRINNIPLSLLKELEPLLGDKDLKIILPIGEKPTKELRKLGEIATTKARIYVDFRGREANTGSVSFSDKIFSIVWLDDQILDISTMEYSKCVKCLLNTFDTGWRYSQKW